MNPVPVLMYHHVTPHKGDMVTVTPEVFEGQMKHLHESGYKTLKLDELIAYINGEAAFKEKAVALTFDDGWLDNYLYAFPVLKRYRLPAAVFIATDWLEKASENPDPSPQSVPTHRESKQLIKKGEEQKVVLTWELAREMADTGLVGFYSHTRSHRRCEQLRENELSEELGGSKRIIEERLGRPCPYLCWPYGGYNDTALKVAENAGYKAVFTTEHGIVKPGADPYAIKRIVVKDNVAWFRKRMLIYANSILSECYLRLRKK